MDGWRERDKQTETQTNKQTHKQTLNVCYSPPYYRVMLQSHASNFRIILPPNKAVQCCHCTQRRTETTLSSFSTIIRGTENYNWIWLLYYQTALLYIQETGLCQDSNETVVEWRTLTAEFIYSELW